MASWATFSGSITAIIGGSIRVVIDTTQKRSRVLVWSIENIHRQILFAEEYEVIAVDNGSTDDTRKMVVSANKISGDKKMEKIAE
ncbi:MAG: hypothetical protein DRH17_00825 [Deltaproteobacteria bacterium]|nr:MAG: hypothetical protein DRH17_00825 [Deltaproteobacteria bacterium]